MIQELRDLTLILFNKEKYKNEVLVKYGNVINSIDDLLGDNYSDLSLLFYLINRHYLHWLDSNPDIAVQESEIKLRRKIYKLLKKVGPKLLGCTQVIENRKYINNPNCREMDDKVMLPKKPVIFVANHGFRDDVLATSLAAGRHAYFYCGSLPLFYNTIEGFAVALVGDVIINRRNKESKDSSILKVKKVLEKGTDLIIFSEGGWNKKSEVLTNHLWRGVYEFSKLGNYDVVPIIHYVRDLEVVNKKNIIHTIVDDPIHLYEMNEKDALIYLRDVLSSWQYKMSEIYGKTTREKELQGFSNHDEKWISTLEKRMQGVPRYDSEIEKKSDYRPKDIVLPETVFESIANIKNITPYNVNMVLDAKKLIKERKNSDFQRMF